MNYSLRSAVQLLFAGLIRRFYRLVFHLNFLKIAKDNYAKVSSKHGRKFANLHPSKRLAKQNNTGAQHGINSFFFPGHYHLFIDSTHGFRPQGLFMFVHEVQRLHPPEHLFFSLFLPQVLFLKDRSKKLKTQQMARQKHRARQITEQQTLPNLSSFLLSLRQILRMHLVSLRVEKMGNETQVSVN